jgi:hypothetical protein
MEVEGPIETGHFLIMRRFDKAADHPFQANFRKWAVWSADRPFSGNERSSTPNTKKKKNTLKNLSL